MKIALSTVLKDQVPREKVLLTLFAEVEQCVNSRPLTHISLDPHDQKALTPNHFLIRSSFSHALGKRFYVLAVCNRAQWGKVQSLADSLYWGGGLYEIDLCIIDL